MLAFLFLLMVQTRITMTTVKRQTINVSIVPAIDNPNIKFEPFLIIDGGASAGNNEDDNNDNSDGEDDEVDEVDIDDEDDEDDAGDGDGVDDADDGVDDAGDGGEVNEVDIDDEDDEDDAGDVGDGFDDTGDGGEVDGIDDVDAGGGGGGGGRESRQIATDRCLIPEHVGNWVSYSSGLIIVNPSLYAPVCVPSITTSHQY